MDFDAHKVSEVFERTDGLRLALLFGSVAQGRAHVGSDVDIAVLGNGFDVLALTAELSLLLGREVQVVSLEKSSFALRKAILRDGICLFELSPGEEARWRFRTLLEVETDGPAYDRINRAYLDRIAGATHG